MTHKDEIRIGIAGLGKRGLHWIRLLQRIEGFRIAAVCDWIEPLQEQALAEISYRSDVKAFSDYDEFVSYGGMDAVGLVVRRADVGAMAAVALEAGKHVSSDVPAACTLEDCWRIVMAAERTGLVYNLAEQTRFWGFVDGWKRLVSEGRLGKITYAEGQYIHYIGTDRWFQDYTTGEFCPLDKLAERPGAQSAYPQSRPPILSASYDLSILLKILDDRVTEVTAMSTRSPSCVFPEVVAPDTQVALMKTEKDTLIRMMNNFTHPRPVTDNHWWQIIGTRGSAEWRRSRGDRPKVWFADEQMNDWAEVDWSFERTDAAAGAAGSGHGGADYYVHAAFREAVLDGRPLEFDVYRAMDTMAPAVVAVDSIAAGSRSLKVPDFRPGEDRKAGQMPANPGAQ